MRGAWNFFSRRPARWAENTAITTANVLSVKSLPTLPPSPLNSPWKSQVHRNFQSTADGCCRGRVGQVERLWVRVTVSYVIRHRIAVISKQAWIKNSSSLYAAEVFVSRWELHEKIVIGWNLNFLHKSFALFWQYFLCEVHHPHHADLKKQLWTIFCNTHTPHFKIHSQSLHEKLPPKSALVHTLENFISEGEQGDLMVWC